MKLWNKRLVSSCPLCNHPIEDVDHILRCQSAGAIEVWQQSVSNILEWLHANNSCPDLANLAINILSSFKSNQPVTLHDNVLFDGVFKVFTAQKSIGWRLFIDGCFSYEWAKVQQEYLDWMGSRKSGKKWVANLICQLWDLQWNTWMHRNSVLHNTPIVELMSGTACLDQALRHEWRLGFNDMPVTIKAMLPDHIETVLQMRVADKKGWLVLLRRTRESQGDNRIQDEFSKEGSSLRKWVGL